MCLYFDTDADKSLRRRFTRAKDESLTFYKVYQYRRRGLHSPYRGDKPIRPGWIVSDRKTTRRVPNDKRVHRGIHVYRQRQAALRSVPFGGGVVVKVTGRKEDLVGAGRWEEAAFTRVHLSREEYQGALRQSRPSPPKTS